MKSNLNSKLSRFNMKKILLFFGMFFMLLSSTHAGNLIYEQQRVIADLYLDDLGYAVVYDIVGVTSSTSGSPPMVGTETGDLKLEIESMQRDAYFYFTNPISNTSFNLTWRFEGSDVVTTQELTLDEVGTYYFKIENNFDGESTSVLLEFPDGYVSILYLTESFPKTFSDATETFITGINDFIDINIQFWKLMYYTFLILLIIGGIVVVVGSMFAFIKWSEKYKNSKDKMMSKRGKK